MTLQIHLKKQLLILLHVGREKINFELNLQALLRLWSKMKAALTG